MHLGVLHLMGQKDSRLTEIEEGISALNWTFNQLITELKSRYPQYAEIANSTFFRWRNGETTGSRKPWAVDCLSMVRADLSTRGISASNSRHLYGIHGDQDSARTALDFDITKLMDTINVSIDVIKVGSPWTAKGIRTVNIKLSTMLGTAVEHILIDGDLNQIKSGSAISFSSSSYEAVEVYLLFRHKVQPEQGLIGWIPSLHPTSIQCSQDSSVPLADWKVIGYAVCVSWGPGEDKSQMRIDRNGIGPHTRI